MCSQQIANLAAAGSGCRRHCAISRSETSAVPGLLRALQPDPTMGPLRGYLKYERKLDTKAL